MFRSFLTALTLVAAMIIPAATANADTMLASWYGPGLDIKDKVDLTASGQEFNQYDPTVAAHKTLPMCTQIKVQSPAGKTKTLIVKDRGPYHDNRQLDVSTAAAIELDFKEEGVAKLKVLEVIPPAKKHRYGESCQRYLG